MKRQWIPIGILICAIVFFLALLKFEDRQVVRNIDFAATVKIQERVDKSSRLRLAAFVENIMEGATFFASPEFTVVVTVMLTGIVIYSRRKKNFGMSGFVIPVALVMIVCIEIYIKSTVHHPSPPFSMIKNPTTMFAMDYINEQFSFPSGHAARAIFLACMVAATMMLSRLRSRRFNVMLVVLVMYVVLVSVSLIYLGHHWLSDVVGGLLIGVACSAVAILLLHQDSNSDSTRDSKHIQDEKKM